MTVESLAKGVWVHRSTHFVAGFGEVTSNGLVVSSEHGALIVDTAWTPAQTAELLDWSEQHVGPVTAVIVTHWHADRTGGLPEVKRRGIASWGGTRTLAEANAHGAPSPSRELQSPFDLAALGVAGEVYFPGAGHTRDNLVVWLAEPGVLFGGCLVKAVEAEGLGNVADGDLAAWPRSVERVQQRYPAARIVVPGHGSPGGAALWVHTQALLAEND